MSEAISVILIVRNEAHNIRACLESVTWADEIIVLDSGSDDGTPNICREYTDKVYETDWPGFGPQKNRALSYAQHPWVLSIDADERVSSELRAALQQAAANPAHNAWEIPRLSSYCGRYMRNGGWWPDYVLRFFRRDSAQFSNDLVHEKVELRSGSIGRISQQTPLIHESFHSLEQVLDKVNQYSSAGASMRHARGKSGSLRQAISHGLWTFIRCYLLRLGFLDGREGFMLAVSNAEGVYYRYLKLMYLGEQQNKIPETDKKPRQS